MTIYSTVRTAMKALQRNAMRALLTTLGIVIGVGAVIAMMEIGAGSSAAIRKTVSSMGANVLNLSPGAASSGGVSFGAGSRTTLTPEDCEAILQECPSVRAASPLVHTRTQVIYGNRNWVPTYIYGTSPSYLDVQAWTIAEGEPFTSRDVLNGNRVCLLGQTLVRELFQGETVVGREIRIKNVTFRVVGVLGAKGANMMGMDQDDIILAPWTSIKQRVTRSALENTNQSSAVGSTGTVNTLNDLYPSSRIELYPEQSAVQAANSPMPIRFTNVDHILAAARSSEAIPSAINEITAVLRERHR
ncbi:MAG: macrolide ABC transporter ATP-binding protein, partial [Deltaproteobacteria bacterium HGW-Deltaproteobacteria-21]